MNVETVDVEIPQFATCYCPMKGGSHFIRGCVGCEFHRGLVKLNDSGGSFDNQYRLLCAAVMPRKITTIEG